MKLAVIVPDATAELMANAGDIELKGADAAVLVAQVKRMIVMLSHLMVCVTSACQFNS
jgi:hypothetical protein